MANINDAFCGFLEELSPELIPLPYDYSADNESYGLAYDADAYGLTDTDDDDFYELFDDYNADEDHRNCLMCNVSPGDTYDDYDDADTDDADVDTDTDYDADNDTYIDGIAAEEAAGLFNTDCDCWQCNLDYESNPWV